jgi:hypothetical protein
LRGVAKIAKAAPRYRPGPVSSVRAALAIAGAEGAKIMQITDFTWLSTVFTYNPANSFSTFAIGEYRVRILLN